MKIKEVFNDYLTNGGIFEYLPKYGQATASGMNIDYVLRHSGNKTVSSLVEEFLDSEGHMSTESKQMLAQILSAIFKDKWDRIYTTITAEYNPIENYNMVESGSDSTNENGTVTYDKGSEVITHNYGNVSKQESLGQSTITDNYGAESSNDTYGSKTNTNEHKVSGFNGGLYGGLTDASYDTDTEGAKTDSHTTSAKTDSHVESAKTNSYTEAARIDSDNNSARTDITDNTSSTVTNHTFTRTGNIGVTTSSQMVAQEISLRAYRFYDEIFKDIDSYLTLSVYE